MTLVCENQTALPIASIPVFRNRTKHRHRLSFYKRQKIMSSEIVTSFVNSNTNSNPLKGPKLATYITSLDHIIYMLQIEEEY